MTLRGAGLGVTLLAFAACGEKERKTTVEGEAARRAVLASTADRLILPTYRDFVARAEALVVALDALGDAEAADASAPADDAQVTAARAAWAEAMRVWQGAELFLLGPAAPMSSAAGGQGLRDRIYSWPVTNACRVDQETAREGWSSGLEAAPVNVRGLDAIEWLLHAPTRDNACPPQAAPNSDGAWTALSDEGVRSRRAAHAAALAADLVVSARALLAAWEPSEGGFRDELAEAGLRPTYRSAQEGLNALSDAMFYLEKEGKDMKLAVPLGLTGCAQDVCPEATESPLSKTSKSHLVENARMFRRVYLGGPEDGGGTGFDDLLRGLGAESLADTFTLRIDEAVVAIEAIPGPLEDALVNDRARVQEAYDKLRAASDILKTELLSVLDLELPERAEGDND